MAATRSLSPASLLRLPSTPSCFLTTSTSLLSLILFFYSLLFTPSQSQHFHPSFPTLLSNPPPPLEMYWGDLEHEIKILVNDITEYFQPKKIHSAIKIKGHLEGRLTFKTLH